MKHLDQIVTVTGTTENDTEYPIVNIPHEHKEDYLPLTSSDEASINRSYTAIKIAASTTSAAMVCILYYHGTKHAPHLWHKVSTLGTNFLINFGTGWETCDYFREKFTPPSSSKKQPSNLTTCLTKTGTVAFVGIGTLVASAPYAITTFRLSKSLSQSLVVFVGDLPINAYSLALFADNEGAWLLNKIWGCFCRAETKKTLEVIKQLKLIRNYIEQRGPHTSLTSFIDRSSSLAGRIEAIANYIATTNNSDSICVDFCLAPINSLLRFGIGVSCGLLLTTNSIGYACSTKSTLPFDYNGNSSWIAPNIILAADYYLSIKTGWTMATDLYDLLLNLIQGKFARSAAWHICGVALALVRFLPAVIALYSGYITQNTYDQYCPAHWQIGPTNEIINWSTVVFNAELLYQLCITAIMAYKYHYGTAEQQEYLIALETIDTTIEEVEKTADAELPNNALLWKTRGTFFNSDISAPPNTPVTREYVQYQSSSFTPA